MRGFECLILLAMAPSVLGLLLPKHRRPFWLDYLALAAAASILPHLAFEGWRWQMIPAYVLAMMLAAIALLGRWHPSAADNAGPRPMRLVFALAALLVYLVAVVLPVALPVFRLPIPTGPYSIGTLSLSYTDDSRKGVFSPDPKEPRRLMAQVWYPAESAPERPPAPYLKGGPFFLGYWSQISTHARIEAPVSKLQPRYPLIIYTHCYMCPVNESTRLMEDLASHGYIVASVSHPYEEVATVYPDGRVLTGDFTRMSAVRHQFPMPEFYRAINAANELVKKQAVFRDFLAKAPLVEQSAKVWTEDNRFILGRLEELDAAGKGILAGRLDLNRIGALGYSIGGAVAGQMCVDDARIKSCVNIDCVNVGDMIDRLPAKPLMFISSEAFKGANDAIFGQAAGPAYRLTIAGTTHQNFGDLTLQAPFLRALSVPKSWASQAGIEGPVVGAIKPLRTGEISQAYVRAFFDRHLLEKTVSLLDGPSDDFPEVDISVRQPASIKP